jgi:hypothetical protein
LENTLATSDDSSRENLELTSTDEDLPLDGVRANLLQPRRRCNSPNSTSIGMVHRSTILSTSGQEMGPTSSGSVGPAVEPSTTQIRHLAMGSSKRWRPTRCLSPGNTWAENMFVHHGMSFLHWSRKTTRTDTHHIDNTILAVRDLIWKW